MRLQAPLYSSKHPREVPCTFFFFFGEKSDDDSEQRGEPTAEPEWASSHQGQDPVAVAAGQEESAGHLEAGRERVLHKKCLCALDHFCCHHWYV